MNYPPKQNVVFLDVLNGNHLILGNHCQRFANTYDTKNPLEDVCQRHVMFLNKVPLSAAIVNQEIRQALIGCYFHFNLSTRAYPFDLYTTVPERNCAKWPCYRPVPRIVWGEGLIVK